MDERTGAPIPAHENGARLKPALGQQAAQEPIDTAPAPIGKRKRIATKPFEMEEVERPRVSAGSKGGSMPKRKQKKVTKQSEAVPSHSDVDVTEKSPAQRRAGNRAPFLPVPSGSRMSAGMDEVDAVPEHSMSSGYVSAETNGHGSRTPLRPHPASTDATQTHRPAYTAHMPPYLGQGRDAPQPPSYAPTTTHYEPLQGVYHDGPLGMNGGSGVFSNQHHHYPFPRDMREVPQVMQSTGFLSRADAGMAPNLSSDAMSQRLAVSATSVPVNESEVGGDRAAFLPDSKGIAAKRAPKLDSDGNPILPKTRVRRLDVDGNPIPRKPRLKLDADGNPVPPKSRVMLDPDGNPVPSKARIRLDAEGNPILPKPRVKKAPQLDPDGNPILPKPRVTVDEDGNPIPPKKRVKLDENGNPIPSKVRVQLDADGKPVAPTPRIKLDADGNLIPPKTRMKKPPQLDANGDPIAAKGRAKKGPPAGAAAPDMDIADEKTPVGKTSESIGDTAGATEKGSNNRQAIVPPQSATCADALVIPKKKKKLNRKPRVPKIVDPDVPYPSPQSAFVVDAERFGIVTTIWHFADCFSNVLRLSPFRLDLLEVSLAEPNATALLDELFYAFLKVLGTDEDALKSMHAADLEASTAVIAKRAQEDLDVWSKKGRRDDKTQRELLCRVLEYEAGTQSEPDMQRQLRDLAIRISGKKVQRNARGTADRERQEAGVSGSMGRSNSKSSSCDDEKEVLNDEDDDDDDVDFNLAGSFYSPLSLEQRVHILQTLVDACAGTSKVHDHIDKEMQQVAESSKNKRDKTLNQRRLLREQIQALLEQLDAHREEFGLLENVDGAEEEKKEEKDFSYLKKKARGKQLPKAEAPATPKELTRREALEQAKAQRAKEEVRAQALRKEAALEQKVMALRAKLEALQQQSKSEQDNDAMNPGRVLNNFRVGSLGHDRHFRYYYFFPAEGCIFVEAQEVEVEEIEATVPKRIEELAETRLRYGSQAERRENGALGDQDMKGMDARQADVTGSDDEASGPAGEENKESRAGAAEIVVATDSLDYVVLPIVRETMNPAVVKSVKWHSFDRAESIDQLLKWLSDDRPYEKALKERIEQLGDELEDAINARQERILAAEEHGMQSEGELRPRRATRSGAEDAALEARKDYSLNYRNKLK
ncbi:hypothetical protein FVE85_0825 [Porphyridium purpureum]|uniref:DDT domain-containing protein n=1 Tax=Porphyridium purpureum TaxID=35688 RepID=A0A5J4Z0D6_PORPP|nr:hypothetical protein FVE85_0825 [Porphyridium purpureum]|eukprot:POR6998..scf208_2